MVAEVKRGAVLDLGPPKTLFATAIRVNPVTSQYAVTRDGQRFLMQESTTAEPPIEVVANWSAVLLQQQNASGR
jgi:hypothetical protein